MCIRDRLYVVSNKFINTMSQVPTITQLLPLPASEDADLKRKSWDYLYEPDPKALLDTLLRRYVESQVYQGAVENLAIMPWPEAAASGHGPFTSSPHSSHRRR